MEQRLEKAKIAIIKAGDYLDRKFCDRHYTTLKSDKTELLSEDIKSEQIIISTLAKAFPRDSFLTEEQETKIRSEYVWVIDPLCGTYSYLRGVETWSLSIGLISGSEYLLGVVYQPLLSSIFYSQTGKGAYKNNRPIHVSSTNYIDRAFISIEHNVFKSGKFDVLSMIKDIKRLRVGHGSGGELSYVAAGHLDAVIKTDQALFHFAGGRAILEEAGGVFLDFEGEPAPTYLDKNKTIDYIACNKILVQKLRKYVMKMK